MLMQVARELLRPVTAKLYNQEIKGYFHGFVQEGSLEDGIGAFAIIEKEDGSITQVDAYTVKFEDVRRNEHA
ncbi:hypothetical protein [Cytobacillus kochii]|uniref:Uncharacterized protein n=1 Tax=Cytobacillus kochii TaxID=859143 RepID=A0A248THE1_9BACI|nr:hypothetical protein [Cytobacillus kochii]ASV67595.1 hypothetical protein CKF48_09835 [Cytobacillus kochii]MDQ0186347.1 hypothetical protein [Cytobacillus kochii]